ncbi:MAG TPA: AEC family transporter, partial [Caldisericia bacterium]|nr:AEC family transporter [Caldisericia bacterium]
PKLIDSTLVSLNSAAIPVLLTVLGLELSRIDVKSNAKSVSLLVGERLILGPVIAIITILLIPLLNGLSAKVVVLESAMPTAFNSLLLAKELGGNYKIVATTVFLTTLLSPFTLSLFVLLLDKIFL